MILDLNNIRNISEDLKQKVEAFSESEFIKEFDLIARHSENNEVVILCPYDLAKNKPVEPPHESKPGRKSGSFFHADLKEIAFEFGLELTIGHSPMYFISLSHVHAGAHTPAPAHEEESHKKKIKE